MKIDVSNGFELGSFHYSVASGMEADADLKARDKYGECVHVRRILNIASDYGDDQYLNTFIHECIEATNDVFCNNKVKHDEITNMANGMTQIIKSLGIQFVHNGGQVPPQELTR